MQVVPEVKKPTWSQFVQLDERMTCHIEFSQTMKALSSYGWSELFNMYNKFPSDKIGATLASFGKEEQNPCLIFFKFLKALRI